MAPLIGLATENTVIALDYDESFCISDIALKGFIPEELICYFCLPNYSHLKVLDFFNNNL